MYKITETVTEETVRAEQPKMIFYGANTCWWTHDPKHLGSTQPDGSGIPCDPRGGVLFQTENAARFLEKALSKPEHYGRHGLKAFWASHHSNLTTTGKDGVEKPWCFVSWEEYNQVLDQQEDDREKTPVTNTN